MLTRGRDARLLTAAGLLLTAGVVVVLYGLHQLVWTNVAADRAAAAEVRTLRKAWQSQERPVILSGRSRGPRIADSAGSADSTSSPRPGEAFALLRIPRLGSSYIQPVIEGSGEGPGGVSDGDLARGVVHYPETGLPGGSGNFAVAGHRATHGEPFAALDLLERGDRIVVQVGRTRHIYAVVMRRIVNPANDKVLLPAAPGDGTSSAEGILTLTTCHPRWSSAFRLVVQARLVSQPRSGWIR